MTENLKRSACPVACVLDIIGDKWTILVIRDMFLGRIHYKEFLKSPEKIATNILANRLSKLVDKEIAEKFPSPDSPGRDAYRLTEKGKRLRPVIDEIVKWGLENIDGTKIGLKATRQA